MYFYYPSGHLLASVFAINGEFSQIRNNYVAEYIAHPHATCTSRSQVLGAQSTRMRIYGSCERALDDHTHHSFAHPAHASRTRVPGTPYLDMGGLAKREKGTARGTELGGGGVTAKDRTQ